MQPSTNLGLGSRLGVILTAILMVVAALVLTAPTPASAATTCSGTQIDSAPLKDGSKKGGTLYVYYNSATGKNCAKATNDLGVRLRMGVQILRCSGSLAEPCEGTDSPTQGVNRDEGEYISYAGPVNTKGSAAGMCIYAIAWIYADTDSYLAQIYGHCG